MKLNFIDSKFASLTRLRLFTPLLKKKIFVETGMCPEFNFVANIKKKIYRNLFFRITYIQKNNKDNPKMSIPFLPLFYLLLYYHYYISYYYLSIYHCILFHTHLNSLKYVFKFFIHLNIMLLQISKNKNITEEKDTQ